MSLLLPALGQAQIFQEDWNGSGPGITGWTLINVDGNTPAEDINYVTDAWVVVDRGGEAPNFGGPDGDFAALSTSWYTPAGTSNDWLVSPQIDLTTAPSAFLLWDAKAQDPSYPDGYTLKLSTNGGNTVADFTVDLFTIGAENTTWTTRTVDLSAYSGQTVRIAFVNNSTDKYVLLVDNILVSEEEIEVPVTYCTPEYAFVEAISSVNFAGITNASAADDEDNSYEDFTAITGSVNTGESYPITLQGNTGGDWEDFFTVFFDWNHNGSFSDTGESYEIGSITNSTGADGIEASGTIAVPADAMVGDTRMRVVKYYGEFTPTACIVSDDFPFGQVEDYTVVVSSLANPSFNIAGFSFYPNPVKNILNVNYSGKIDKVEVYNLMGQKVFSQEINAEAGQLNVSELPTGQYIVKLQSANAVKSIKIIKE
ncbi:MAG TPA: choice-of-anchor J domain-containing protein [Flavobacterium sp.]